MLAKEYRQSLSERTVTAKNFSSSQYVQALFILNSAIESSKEGEGIDPVRRKRAP